jgi:hypothetical protein
MVSKILDKLPLRTVLIVPFILQIVGAVGLVGYLSFRNGQKAVNNLASQLMSEVSLRVEQNLQAYVTTPHQINQSKLDAVKARVVKDGKLISLGEISLAASTIISLYQFYLRWQQGWRLSNRRKTVKWLSND